MLKFIVLSSVTVFVAFSEFRSTEAQEPGYSFASEEFAKLTAAGIREKLERLSRGNYEQRSWYGEVKVFVQSTLAAHEGGFPWSERLVLVERSSVGGSGPDFIALEILNLLVKPTTSLVDIHRFIQLTSNNRVQAESVMALLGSKLRIFPPKTEGRDQKREYLLALSQFASAFRQQFPWGDEGYTSIDAQRFFESEATRVMNSLLPEAEVKREFYHSLAKADPGNQSLYQGIYYRSLGIDTTRPINQMLLPSGSIRFESTDSIASLLYHHPDVTPAKARERIVRLCRASNRCKGLALYAMFSQMIEHFSAQEQNRLENLRALFSELRSAVGSLASGIRSDPELQLARAFEPYFAEMIVSLPKSDFLYFLGEFIELAPETKGWDSAKSGGWNFLKYRLARPSVREIKKIIQLGTLKSSVSFRSSREYHIWEAVPENSNNLFSRLASLALLERAGLKLSRSADRPGALLRRNLLAAANWLPNGMEASSQALELIFTHGHFDRELVTARAKWSEKGATRVENRIFYWPKSVLGALPEDIQARLAIIHEVGRQGPSPLWIPLVGSVGLTAIGSWLALQASVDDAHSSGLTTAGIGVLGTMVCGALLKRFHSFRSSPVFPVAAPGSSSRD